MSEARDRDRARRRPLTESEQALVERARRKAHVLYEGKAVPHRSCGVALAETFNLPTRSYQSLRRGGITGEGDCGAIGAGELILGEILGDPDPTGPVTDVLREAADLYRELWTTQIDRGPGGLIGTIVCNELTAPFGDFHGAERHAFCTSIESAVAAIVEEVLVRCGHPVEIDEVQIEPEV